MAAIKAFLMKFSRGGTGCQRSKQRANQVGSTGSKSFCHSWRFAQKLVVYGEKDNYPKTKMNSYIL
jgi:hypothetical protein